MATAHIEFQDAAPWYFYLPLVGMIIVVAWWSYLNLKGAWQLFRLSRVPLLQKAPPLPFGPLLAMSAFAYLWAIGKIIVTIILVCGIWLMVEANFLSFRELDFSATAIHISYEWHGFDREFALADVSNITWIQVHSRRAWGCKLEIETVNGQVYHSMTSFDDPVVGDCRRIVDIFHQKKSR